MNAVLDGTPVECTHTCIHTSHIHGHRPKVKVANQDSTKVLGRTISQSDTSSLTFDWDCTKLRMLLKRRLHQVLWWSNCTSSSTVREIANNRVCLHLNSGRVAQCLNGSTSVTKWVPCHIDYKQTPQQTDYSQTGSHVCRVLSTMWDKNQNNF